MEDLRGVAEALRSNRVSSDLPYVCVYITHFLLNKHFLRENNRKKKQFFTVTFFKSRQSVPYFFLS